jgi:hydroxymethylbilane synthase
MLITAGPGPTGLDDLPEGALVGTSSLRRQAQLLARRSDLRVVPLRGNVHTRLRRIEEGELTATLLARAGLRRLGLGDTGTPLPFEQMLPAAGQGAIGVTCRGDDTAAAALLAAIGDPAAAIEVAAERSMLAALDGSCRTPIGALGRLGADGALTIEGLAARPDGTQVLRGRRRGPAGDGPSMGHDLGCELRRCAGPGFFEP